MNRRAFTAGLCSCAASALTACVTTGQTPATQAGFGPGYKPIAATDEGGLWAQMEKAEADLKRSRFLVRDPDVNRYVSDIACKLSQDFCPDLRVYVVQTPYFNAMMAPNGMMQIWTGLLLRVQNEAQLAAVIGHEMGHYLNRHSLQRWRDVRGKTDAAAVFGFAGLPGLVIQLGLLASIFSYSRDQEREADAAGFDLMAKAGYQPLEAAKVWEQLIAEQNAAEVTKPRNVFFASHPEPGERAGTLRARAAGLNSPAGTETQPTAHWQHLKGIRSAMLADELKLRQFGQSEVLADLLLREQGNEAEIYFFKGEIYRHRSADGDAGKAYEAYGRAIEIGTAPPETYRSLGLVQLREKEFAKAAASFQRYLELVPAAPDRDIVNSYIQLRS